MPDCANCQPCAERVLIALNNACRHLPQENRPIDIEMVKIVAETEGESNRTASLTFAAIAPNDLPSILRKEAVYCAMGRLSRSLATQAGLQPGHGIDFGAFLRGVGSWLGQGVPL